MNQKNSRLRLQNQQLNWQISKTTARSKRPKEKRKKAKIKPVELLDAVIKIIDKYPINSDDAETSTPI